MLEMILGINMGLKFSISSMRNGFVGGKRSAFLKSILTGIRKSILLLWHTLIQILRQHVGHGRTYTLADTHARYMRMKGYNVLFPMGFHYTGTPILAMSKRVKPGDRDLIETFMKIHHVSADDIARFVEPIEIARFFHNEIKQGMVEMGYSIDWSGEFTTIDNAYSRFISWQFKTLRRKGLIIQGSYPVAWCLNDQNAVSQHDTIGDIEPDFNEYVMIKYKQEESFLTIPCATLRPETIYGVTNLWINPTSKYVIIRMNDSKKRVEEG